MKNRWGHTICTTTYYWILERMRGRRGVMRCELCSHGACDHSGSPLPAPNKLWSLCAISVPWALLQFFFFPVHRYMLKFSPFSPIPAPVSWLSLSLTTLSDLCHWHRLVHWSVFLCHSEFTVISPYLCFSLSLLLCNTPASQNLQLPFVFTLFSVFCVLCSLSSLGLYVDQLLYFARNSY